MPMVRRRVPPAQLATGFALAAVVLLSGCSGGDSDNATPTTRTSSQATARSPMPGDRKPAAVTIDVDDMTFAPAEVTVKVGDTVTWEFDDRVPHSVQGIGDKAMGINSPIFNKGEWRYTFIAPGTYRYICSLHPQMRGTITVE